MSKLKTLLSLLSNKIKFRFKNIKNKNPYILNGENKNDIINKLFHLSQLSVYYFSNFEMTFLKEAILIKNNIKKDYSKNIYRNFENDLNLEEGSLTFKVINHIGLESLKIFEKLNLGLYEASADANFVINNIKSETYFLRTNDTIKFTNLLPSYFHNKKVLVADNYNDLIKIQYVKLKASNKYRTKFNYSLYTLSFKETLNNIGLANYFETIDALKMFLLNYSFDLLVLKRNPFSLLLQNFVINLESKPSSIVLDDTIYSLFDITKKHSEITNESQISLEDYQKTINDDFLTAFVNKEDLERGKK